MFERFEDAGGFAFDCDGTLLDSMKIWRQVEEEMIAMAGGHISDEDFVTLQAVSIEEGAAMLHERYGAGRSAADLVSYVDSRLLGFYGGEVEAFDGAAEFVRRIRALGIPCCIVSSSPVRYLEAGLAHCGLLDEFCAVISTETAGHSKQNAAIYELAAAKLGSAISRCWGMDDSLYAVKAMAAAGMSTIAFYEDDKAGTVAQLGEYADIVIEAFAELLR